MYIGERTMRFAILPTLVISLLLTFQSHAQPAVEFLYNFDSMGDETFYDIYAVSDSGFIMCGRSWSNLGEHIHNGFIVRTDSDGEALWTRNYEHFSIMFSIIETEDGNFLIGGTGGSQFRTMMIDGDGNVIWQNSYDDAYCFAVIELKNGNFLLGGGDGRYGRLILINDEGDPIWSRNYNPANSALIRGLRETDGGAVAAGRGAAHRIYYWALMVELEQGNTVWSNLYDDTSYYARTLVAGEDGGFALSGGHSYVELLKIDGNGDQQFYHGYRENMRGGAESHCIIQMDSGYLIVGTKLPGIDGERNAPLTIRTTTEGDIIWQQIYNLRGDERFSGHSGFQSVVRGYDGSMVAAGYAMTAADGNDIGLDGIIMKLEPEFSGAPFIYHSPTDTMLSALPGDSIRFITRVHGAIEDYARIYWIMEEETLSVDTTIVLPFNEFGEHILSCHVTDHRNTAVINWHVNVVEFHINSHQPDNHSIQTRRNSTIDFSVSTRALEDNPVEYLWQLDDEQIADDNSVSIRFERGREHSVTAVASQGELSDSVTWQVMVNDLIVDYMPERFDLSVPIDTTFEFEVFPLDPEDDSLQFLWRVNGDSLGNRSWLLKNFDEEGLYNITVYVTDTTESDSLAWEVNVEANRIYTDAPRHPDTTTLQAPVPNPFNSVTTVRYYLPTASDVKLSLFDLNGRLVKSLLHQHKNIGSHSIEIDGSSLVSGIYFVRMSVGDTELLQKMVLVK